MQIPRGAVGFSGLRDSLFSVGGENFGGVLKEAERYSISTNTWSRLPNMHQERKWPGLCCFDELGRYIELYCFCGLSKKRLKSIERFDGVTQKWNKFEKDQGTIGNFNIKAIPYKDQILVFGGEYNQGRMLKTMYLYLTSGRIKERLLENSFIPGEQGAQPYFKDKYDRIFTVQEDKGQETIQMYDGREWMKVSSNA